MDRMGCPCLECGTLQLAAVALAVVEAQGVEWGPLALLGDVMEQNGGVQSATQKHDSRLVRIHRNLPGSKARVL